MAFRNGIHDCGYDFTVKEVLLMIIYDSDPGNSVVGPIFYFVFF